MEKLTIQTPWVLAPDGTVSPAVTIDYPVDEATETLEAEWWTSPGEVARTAELPSPNMVTIQYYCHPAKADAIEADGNYAVTNRVTI